MIGNIPLTGKKWRNKKCLKNVKIKSLDDDNELEVDHYLMDREKNVEKWSLVHLCLLFHD